VGMNFDVEEKNISKFDWEKGRKKALIIKGFNLF
jgi:hypothetical protein